MRFNEDDSNASGGEASADYMISEHGRRSDIAKEKDPVTGVKWGDVIKKEARGSDAADLGEIQDVDQTYVITQRGNVKREKFFLPKNLVERYDGHSLVFRTNKDEARNKFMGKEL